MRKYALAICLVLVGLSVSLSAVAINIESLGPGVYVVKGEEPVNLSATPIADTGQKKSNMMGFSANLKGKRKMTSKIEGGKAGLRLPAGEAVFLFRGIDVSEFVVVRLDSSKKSREFTSSTSTMGLRNIKNLGAEKKSGDVPEDETVPYKVDRIDPMTQRVTLTGIVEGEYAFYNGSQKVYDFGVDTTVMASTR